MLMQLSTNEGYDGEEDGGEREESCCRLGSTQVSIGGGGSCCCLATSQSTAPWVIHCDLPAEIQMCSTLRDQTIKKSMD
jgi:hypothetical protein